MNSFINLAKAFTKAGDMSHPAEKKHKIKIILFSIFAIGFIFIPVLIVVGIMVKIMTEILMPLGVGSMGVEFMLYVISFFTIIFGMNVVFSEFYFANDIEFTLPWPVRAWQLVGARFVSVFFMENVMQILLVISCIIGYGIATQMNISGWLLSVVGIVTLPIIPLAYCGIVSILIMAFTRIIRNKDVIQKISVALIFIALVLLVLSLGNFKELDFVALVEGMGQQGAVGFSVWKIIFPNVSLFVKTFSEGSIIALLEYVVINLLYCAVMLVLAELLYFKSIANLTSSSSNSKTKGMEKLIASSKIHSPTYAYFVKEIRILVRTPAFFTNCVIINFLWPFFIYAISKIAGKEQSLMMLKEQYAQDDVSLQLIFMLGAVGISVILSALNSISSNALSREGKHFSFMKYIPISYAIQWNVKVMVGVMFSALGVLIFYIPLCILVNVPLWHIVVFVVLSLMSVIFVSYMGIYIDSIQPKLIWDDELNCLRGNYNSFFAMAIAIAFVAVVCCGGYLIFKKSGVGIGISALILFIILLTANIIVAAMTIRSGAKNIQGQEEA